MIRKQYIHGKEIPTYSIGQLCAKINRHPCTIRKMQREGFIPEPAFRHPKNNYRLYTLHEVNIIKYVFDSFGLRRGVKFPANAGTCLRQEMEALHAHYENENHPLPSSAMTDAMRAVLKGEKNATPEEDSSEDAGLS